MLCSGPHWEWRRQKEGRNKPCAKEGCLRASSLEGHTSCYRKSKWPVASLHIYFQAVASINSSLERADRVYRQLSSHRTPLDLLLTRILEHGDAEVSKVRLYNHKLLSLGFLWKLSRLTVSLYSTHDKKKTTLFHWLVLSMKKKTNGVPVDLARRKCSSTPPSLR